MQPLEFIKDKSASYDWVNNHSRNLKSDLEFRILLFSHLLNTRLKIFIFPDRLPVGVIASDLKAPDITIVTPDLPESSFLQNIVEPEITRNSLLNNNLFPDNTETKTSELTIIPLISGGGEIPGVMLLSANFADSFSEGQIEILWSFNQKFPIVYKEEPLVPEKNENQAEELKLIHQVIQQEIGIPLQNLKKTVRRLENETEPLLSPSVYQCIIDIEKQVDHYLGVIGCLDNLIIENGIKDAEFLDLDAILRTLTTSVSVQGKSVSIVGQMPFIRASAVEISEAFRIILKMLVDNSLPNEKIVISHTSESGQSQLLIIKHLNTNPTPGSVGTNSENACHSVQILLLKKLLHKNGISLYEHSETSLRGFKLIFPTTG
jgi:hypothetical protein